MKTPLWTNTFRPSLPSRGAWIEISSSKANGRSTRSLPSRGAWIEIRIMDAALLDVVVAPLTGSVDRNHGGMKGAENGAVAPLTGSVDRNLRRYRDAQRTMRRSPHGERG